MTRNLATLSGGALLALLKTGTALAATCATVTFTPGTPSIPTWNPINPTAQEATFTATITRLSSNFKSVRLIFLDSNSSVTPTRIGTTSGPRYDIYNVDTGNIISFASGTVIGNTNPPKLSFGNGSSDVLLANLKIQIPANILPSEDFIGGSAYSETLNYAIQCFKGGGNGQPAASDGPVASNLTLRMSIPKLVSIVTATPSAINFGNFTTTIQQALITVKSTSTLNVTVNTDKGGQMIRSGAVAPYPLNSSIPYTMKWNNTLVAPGGTLTNQTRAGVTGTAYPLSLTLAGVPSGKLAGTYSDVITVTITAGT